MLEGLTKQEFDRLSELAQRYAQSNHDRSALTEEDWKFVEYAGNKLSEVILKGGC